MTRSGIIRTTLGFMCLFAFGASAHGQQPTQAVTFSELASSTITAHMLRNQANQRNGRKYTIKMETDWTIDIEAGDALEVKSVQTAHTARGKRKDKPIGGRYLVNTARNIKSRGSGEAVWKYADGRLEFLRTFPQGPSEQAS